MTVSQHEVLKALDSIVLPNANAGLVAAGAVQDLSLDGATVRVRLAIQSPDPGLSQVIRGQVEQTLTELEGVKSVQADVQVMLPMAAAGPAPAAEPAPTWADRIPDVRNVIAVASGKGGVGKSTVSANLAIALAREGQRVGLLDADIYGPSQQMMMAPNGEPSGDPSGKIRPVEGAGGVKVMSLGFIIDADQPVIWRGPMLMKALEQLVSDVAWGELDTLVIDLPPGTGDVALTLCQNVPLAGAVIVTTPQDVALIDARKSLHMFAKLGVPVLGMIENMAGFKCPECGHVEHVFGTGGGQRTAEQLEIPLLGSIPLDPAVVAGGDSGTPVVADRPDSAAAQAFVELSRSVEERLHTAE